MLEIGGQIVQDRRGLDLQLTRLHDPLEGLEGDLRLGSSVFVRRYCHGRLVSYSCTATAVDDLFAIVRRLDPVLRVDQRRGGAVTLPS